MDEFDEFRMKKNMSDEMKYREKVTRCFLYFLRILRIYFYYLQVECFAALESIAHKINERDADMRSHIVLSMFKVAAAEANVPEPPDSGSLSRHPPNILFYTVFLTFTIHRFFSGLCSFSSYLWFALNLAATKWQWNKLYSDDEAEWLEEHFESNISNDSENRSNDFEYWHWSVYRCKSFINVELLSIWYIFL